VLSTSVATLPRAVEPRASRDVFGVRHRCRGPAVWLSTGLGRFLFSSGFWDFAPPASRFRVLVRPRLGLGTKGRVDPRTVTALGFSSFGCRVRRAPGSPLPGPIRSWALSSRRSAILPNARHAFTMSRHRFRRLREGALQRFDEFDGLSNPAMFSSGRVYPYEVLHRPRNARRSLFAGQRSPAVTSGATCLELSFT